MLVRQVVLHMAGGKKKTSTSGGAGGPDTPAAPIITKAELEKMSERKLAGAVHLFWNRRLFVQTVDTLLRLILTHQRALVFSFD